MIKVIKSAADHEAALAAIDSLLDRDPNVGTPEADQLEILTVLVEEYESRIVKFAPPDPIEAIRFRMEQQNLTPRDLIPYIGSRSKVSEVLSGKRPLTLSMIRALHSGLGIPASILLKGRDRSELEAPCMDWDNFPIREMVSRAWIKGEVGNLVDNAEDVVQRFFGPLGSGAAVALYTKTDHIRAGREMDRYALIAWTARVLIRAKEEGEVGEYQPGSVNLDFMREVARLSWSDTGPLLAREYLAKHGVILIVEQHLSRTYLDGAAILTYLDRPVIGLTVRHDRIDNFWFSLMHELAHISLHMRTGVDRFFDDLDAPAHSDAREREADDLASEALIPSEVWEKSPASRLRSPDAVRHLANQLRIHPAIVAGRMRYHFNAYRLLGQLVGHGEVRKLFQGTQSSG